MTGPDPPDQARSASLMEEAYPLQRHLGFELTGWRVDYCQITLPLAPYLLNRYGILHGGLHTTFLDTVMGFCGCYTGDRACHQLVLSLGISFLAQSTGRTLIAEGRRTGGGPKTFFAAATVCDDTSAQIANGTGVFRYPAPPQISPRNMGHQP